MTCYKDNNNNVLNSYHWLNNLMYRTILKREHHSHITEVDKETHKGYVTQALHLKFEWLPRFSYSLILCCLSARLKGVVTGLRILAEYLKNKCSEVNFKLRNAETSRAVQWLGLCASTIEGLGLIHQQKHLLWLYWWWQSLWLCGSQ